MQYVEHPWINPGVIEQRAYQDDIVKSVSGNTLCVLPTGLGKTSIAALVVVKRMEKGGKALFLAPTRPLVGQHKQTFERVLKVGIELRAVTGETKPEERHKLYSGADIIFSTPQTIKNDLKKGLIDLSDFVVCVFDEAHRCVGDYDYSYIAKCYMNSSKNPLILGLTASPGSQKYKIEEVRQRLFIDSVIIKTRDDKDVKPYVQDVKNEWISVELPQELKSIREYLDGIKSRRIKKLYDMKILHSYYTTKSQLLRIQQELARKKTGAGFMAMSLIAEVIKVDHALLLLETQSIHSLSQYFDDLKHDTTRATARLMKEEEFAKAVRLTKELEAEGKEHPKMACLKSLVTAELSRNKDARIIIFAQYRSTLEKIRETVKSIKHAAPIEFIGQAKKKGKGMSQKEQNHILNEFRMGFYNILCASQVAEEGLDVVETDLVIFYEPVPSAIRKIQRAGRTARTHAGRVVVLITKGTRDEAYHWSAHHKEKKMKKILYDMQKGNIQKTLSDYKEPENDHTEGEDFGG